MRSTLLLILPSLTSSVLACTPVGQTIHTFYGFPDNDPPGPGTAYNCGRNFIAGGTGTYSDPLTFASAQGEFEPCEIIYDPYTRKYLRFEDYCQACTEDWEVGVSHIDVWTGSVSVNGGQEQIQCENELTPREKSQTIVRGPAGNLPVDCELLLRYIWDFLLIEMLQWSHCTSKVGTRRVVRGMCIRTMWLGIIVKWMGCWIDICSRCWGCLDRMSMAQSLNEVVYSLEC